MPSRSTLNSKRPAKKVPAKKLAPKVALSCRDAVFASDKMGERLLDRTISTVVMTLSEAHRRHGGEAYAEKFSFPTERPNRALLKWVGASWENYNWTSRFLQGMLNRYRSTVGERHALHRDPSLYLIAVPPGLKATNDDHRPDWKSATWCVIANFKKIPVEG